MNGVWAVMAGNGRVHTNMICMSSNTSREYEILVVCAKCFMRQENICIENQFWCKPYEWLQNKVLSALFQ